MIRTIRNRIIFYNLLLVLGLTGGVLLFVALVEIEAGQLPGVILAGGAIALGLSVLLSAYLAASIERPLRRLTSVVERMGSGDLSARLLPMRQDEAGKLTGAVNVMADRLTQQMAHLHQEQGRLSTVLNHMADGVIFISADNRVALINPAAARLLELDQAWALGRSFAQAVRDHRLMDLWQQCRLENREVTGTLESRADDRFMRILLTPIPGSGPVPDFLVILQDLTQTRRLETARRDFVSNISHELRTPLASLRALADTLRDGALDDPPAAIRFLDRMDVEVDSLTQMVQELLELSRIESGQVPFRLQPTDLVQVAHGAVDRLTAQAERAQVILNADLPPDFPRVMADGERLAQVLTNLIHNAIKFTDAGGQITVRVNMAPAGSLPVARRPDIVFPDPQVPLAVVTVTDTGVGIPSADLPRIFERFYKTDRARASGGTGLGLAIAKHVIHAHHGHIWAASRLGEGSTFTFVLPLADR
ncbi:MAG: HAMP domain-containing protein [Caldilineaceae bacterium]|nr:HAMP domain-containing protein [Caldilineaceae bacterium]MBP8108938.1 HAMP domain-containing protein [Caldilineaceae bacterium]MBP8123828.1 HAMP domain-containing protein [Caldilineaceae bacterium]MBP9073877.1 HAMP domain-containing protein [Caldilineaceae bacterium]